MDFENRRRRGGAGFTLVELLVVIAIIGVLVALLLPAVQAAREAARRSQCANNVKQFGLAVINYTSRKEEFPAGMTQRISQGRAQGDGWMLMILPYAEQQAIYQAWDFTNRGNNFKDANSPGAAQMGFMICPSDQPQERVVNFLASPGNSVVNFAGYYSVTSYAGNHGIRSYYAGEASYKLNEARGDVKPEGIFFLTGPASKPNPNQTAVALSEVTDGTSNTFMIGEHFNKDDDFDALPDGSRSGLLKHQWSLWSYSGGDKATGHFMRGGTQPINFSVRECPPTGGQYACQDQRLMGWGSGHPGGAQIGFCDGSLRFFSDSTSKETLNLLCTRDYGEVVSDLP